MAGIAQIVTFHLLPIIHKTHIVADSIQLSASWLDLWGRIAGRERDKARALMSGCLNSPYVLTRRLYLFAMCSEGTFAPQEAWAALQSLDDETFWIGSAQVEIMRLATKRWQQFGPEDRQAFETRIRQGLPRALFPEDAFENEEDWNSVSDFAAMKRLARLQLACGSLTPQSQALLDQIRSRHPRWTPGGRRPR